MKDLYGWKKTTVSLPFQRLNPIRILFHCVDETLALFVTGVTNRIGQTLVSSNDKNNTKKLHNFLTI